MNNIKIIGYGSSVPENVLTNDDLTKFIETNDEWIVQRTGIKERRITDDKNTSFYAINAAKKALESAKISAEELDLIIVSTSTPDYVFPSTACLVQGEIGAKNAFSFDLSAACTGFVYASDIAGQYIKTGRVKKALVIGAEVLSKAVDWKDRGTCILFGDGAGAFILSATDENLMSESYMRSDATKSDVLKLIGMPVIDINENPEKIDRPLIYMNGQEVFKFACGAVAETIENIAKQANIEIGEIDHFVLHQANSRIIEYVQSKMNIDAEKIYVNINKYGNTSAATVPILLSELNDNNKFKKGDKLLIIGFGAGLTWGGMLFEI